MKTPTPTDMKPERPRWTATVKLPGVRKQLVIQGGRLTILSGPPGTGTTFVLKAIRQTISRDRAAWTPPDTDKLQRRIRDDLETIGRTEVGMDAYCTKAHLKRIEKATAAAREDLGGGPASFTVPTGIVAQRLRDMTIAPHVHATGTTARRLEITKKAGRSLMIADGEKRWTPTRIRRTASWATWTLEKFMRDAHRPEPDMIDARGGLRADMESDDIPDRWGVDPSREWRPHADLARRLESEIGLSWPEPGRTLTTAEDTYSEIRHETGSVESLHTWLNGAGTSRRLLLVDRPENGVHPRTQRLLALLYANLARRGVDVVIATSADYLLKELNLLIGLNELDLNGRERPPECEEAGIGKHDRLDGRAVRVYTAMYEEGGTTMLSPAVIDPGGADYPHLDREINAQNDVAAGLTWK